MTREGAASNGKEPGNMTEVNLGGLSRYERRIRALWSAEPQRGDYHESDDAARNALAAECALNQLNHWATVQSRAVKRPKNVGDFVYCGEWFNILGITVMAFPTAAIRDAFVDANPGAEAVDDAAFWP